MPAMEAEYDPDGQQLPRLKQHDEKTITAAAF
jgi:hypothetical protein